METQEEDGITTVFDVPIDAHKMADDGDRLAQIAGVPMHLAAAGLLWAKLDLVPEALKHAHDSLSRLRKERIVITGDEKGDAHESTSSFAGVEFRLTQCTMVTSRSGIAIEILFP
jgi:hypothetical protein